jgi:hypothetical protein
MRKELEKYLSSRTMTAYLVHCKHCIDIDPEYHYAYVAHKVYRRFFQDRPVSELYELLSRGEYEPIEYSYEPEDTGVEE